MVALAGPPASGKSTLAAHLGTTLEHTSIVPMDGFHLDDAVLAERGHSDRKGAPHTFDIDGFSATLSRLQSGTADVAVPVFDRRLELSRNAARIVPTTCEIVLVEGNWLLLEEPAWIPLRRFFSLTVVLDVPMETLERRLVQRWRQHGRTDAEARAWIAANDLPNAQRAIAGSGESDIRYNPQPDL